MDSGATAGFFFLPLVFSSPPPSKKSPIDALCWGEVRRTFTLTLLDPSGNPFVVQTNTQSDSLCRRFLLVIFLHLSLVLSRQMAPPTILYKCSGTHGCQLVDVAAVLNDHCRTLGHGRSNTSAKYSAARSRVDDYDERRPLELECCVAACNIGPAALKKHVLQSHRNDRLPYGCQICCKRAKTWSNAVSHILYHAPIDVACGGRCRACGKWFANSKLLKAHGSTRAKASAPCKVGVVDTSLLDDWLDIAKESIPYDAAQDIIIPPSVYRSKGASSS